MNAVQVSQNSGVIERHIIEYRYIQNSSSLVVLFLLGALLIYLEYYVKKNKSENSTIKISNDKEQNIEQLNSKVHTIEDNVSTIKDIDILTDKISIIEDKLNSSDASKNIEILSEKINTIEHIINSNNLDKMKKLEEQITNISMINDKLSELTCKEEDTYQKYIGVSEIHQEGCYRYKLEASIIKKKINTYKENKDWLNDTINDMYINRLVKYLTNSNGHFWHEARNIDCTITGVESVFNPEGWWKNSDCKPSEYETQSTLVCNKYEWDSVYEITLIRSKIYCHDNYRQEINADCNRIYSCAQNMKWEKVLTSI